MKGKLSFMVFGILALFAISFVSAVSFTDNVQDVVLSPQDNSTTFTLSSNGNSTFSVENSSFVLKDSDGDEVTITISPASSLDTQSVEFTAEATGDLENFDFADEDSEEISFTITNSSNSSDTASKTITFTFENKDYCKSVSNPGELKTRIEDVRVIKGFGDEDSYWYPYDEVEVEVSVENNGEWDVRDIELSWALYNTAGRKIDSDDVDTFKLRDGRDNTVTFSFVLDEDIDRFEDEDAILYVRAEGKVDDSDSDYDNEKTCDAASPLEVRMRTSDDFVIATDFMVNDEKVTDDFVPLSCNEKVKVSSKIVNLGDSDQDDVEVRVFSKGLEIDQIFEVGDIDAFEDKMINFEFEVPKDMEEKSYSIQFEVLDEDNDVFENSEDDKAVTYLDFKGLEDCKIVPPTIKATLVGDAKVGKALVINAWIRNDDLKKNLTYFVGAKGYEDWATLRQVRPEFVQIGPGRNENVEFIFEVKRDIEPGEYSFNLVATANGEDVLTQPVAVTLENRGFSVKDLWDRAVEKIDWKIGSILLINLILLIAIIIVARKILKR